MAHTKNDIQLFPLFILIFYNFELSARPSGHESFRATKRTFGNSVMYAKKRMQRIQRKGVVKINFLAVARVKVNLHVRADSSATLSKWETIYWFRGKVILIVRRTDIIFASRSPGKFCERCIVTRPLYIERSDFSIYRSFMRSIIYAPGESTFFSFFNSLE